MGFPFHIHDTMVQTALIRTTADDPAETQDALHTKQIDQVHFWNCDDGPGAHRVSTLLATPTTYDYLPSGRDLGTAAAGNGTATGAYAFRVKATNDVAVLLQGSDGLEYELVLGGWDNTLSIFRQGRQTVGLASSTHLLLDTANWNDVGIAWDAPARTVTVTLNGATWTIPDLPCAAFVGDVAHATGWGGSGLYDIPMSPATPFRHAAGDPQAFYAQHPDEFRAHASPDDIPARPKPVPKEPKKEPAPVPKEKEPAPVPIEEPAPVPIEEPAPVPIEEEPKQEEEPKKEPAAPVLTKQEEEPAPIFKEKEEEEPAASVKPAKSKAPSKRKPKVVLAL